VSFVCSVECQRNIPRNARASRNEAALEFECPEEFGYYPHPRDCTQYYVCVFGGALLESCTGGLMYSHELQTCDWPRNVGCPEGGSPSKETEDDPLLERPIDFLFAVVNGLREAKRVPPPIDLYRRTSVDCATIPITKPIVLELHPRSPRATERGRESGEVKEEKEMRIRDWNDPVRQPVVTTTSVPVPQITEKQIRQRQQVRNYHEDEYEPATEVESDRQQRVYRGQPSTIGQVQRDRDGLRRNVISEREKESLLSTRAQTEAHYRTQVPSSESPRVAKILASTVAPVISKSYYSDPDQSYPYYTIYDDDVSIYKDDDYNQYTVNQTVAVQPSVKISEVNTKQYQKPKKVAVNEADKYNLNQDVTAQDYDIYENQAQLNKNKFRITDGQSFRPNVLSHPVVHVTTPNAIVDTFIPLTTTTQPPSTTSRPYTVNAPSRGRPQQVHRGTAPPRSRPTLKPSTEIVSKAQEFVDIYRYPPLRPSPIYPTPQVDKPAAKCRKDVCLLPDCSCGGADIPGGIPVEQTPQIVLLTFDDAVNDLNKPLYTDLFENGRKNPNGCPITATFYVSHEWTDYSQVQNLYADGHEMASHTVS
ncbi:hypothetical protein WH47_06743, partial [Habropoda laboriosa]